MDPLERRKLNYAIYNAFDNHKRKNAIKETLGGDVYNHRYNYKLIEKN